MADGLMLELIGRWVHIFSAIIAVGGTLFLVLVLKPAIAKAIPEDQQEAFRKVAMKRWKIVFHPLIILFLGSGFYNYLQVTSAQHVGQGLYHMLFGIKFLLALMFFTLAIISTSTMKWSEKFRDGTGIWGTTVLLALVIVMVGGYMKSMPIVEKETPALLVEDLPEE